MAYTSATYGQYPEILDKEYNTVNDIQDTTLSEDNNKTQDNRHQEQ